MAEEIIPPHSQLNQELKKSFEYPSWIGKDMIYPLESIKFKEVLGEGNFGVVRKALIKHGHAVYTVAVKTTGDKLSTKYRKCGDNQQYTNLIPSDSLTHRRTLRALIDEAKTMTAVGAYNENIVNLQGVCFDLNKKGNLHNMHLILEYCAHRDMRSYLLKHQHQFQKSLSLKDEMNSKQTLLTSSEKHSIHDLEQLLLWCFQIACGMNFLSSMSIYHGDLACRNILLTEELVVKISDFGLSQKLNDTESADFDTRREFPIKWLALEVLRLDNISVKSDVWSFGVVLWEIFSLGQDPYPSEISPLEILDILEQGRRLRSPEFAPKQISDYMKRCWKEDPDHRPTYRNFMDDLERTYGVEDSLENEQQLNHNSAIDGVKLKYPKLIFHEDHFRSQFDSLQEANRKFLTKTTGERLGREGETTIDKDSSCDSIQEIENESQFDEATEEKNFTNPRHPFSESIKHKRNRKLQKLNQEPTVKYITVDKYRTLAFTAAKIIHNTDLEKDKNTTEKCKDEEISLNEEVTINIFVRHKIFLSLVAVFIVIASLISASIITAVGGDTWSDKFVNASDFTCTASSTHDQSYGCENLYTESHREWYSKRGEGYAAWINIQLNNTIKISGVDIQQTYGACFSTVRVTFSKNHSKTIKLNTQDGVWSNIRITPNIQTTFINIDVLEYVPEANLDILPCGLKKVRVKEGL